MGDNMSSQHGFWARPPVQQDAAYFILNCMKHGHNSACGDSEGAIWDPH